MKFERQETFSRNENLEQLLKEINNSILGPIEEEILEGYRIPKYPIVLIMGCARSGTTLMIQWLANTGRFAYPTNLLSRFYRAPYIGAKIQQLLTDPKFDFNQEILDFNSEICFVSNVGKTKGALAPNGFWYFWRRFFPDDELSLTEEVDDARLVAELAAVEAVFGKPFVLKGMVVNWNIPYLSSILEKVLFIFTERHPFYNIQSLLETRVKYFGDRKAWYSFKPKEYDMLKDLDPFKQVAGQVYFTNRAIEEGLKQVDAARGLRVSYEEFCTAPERVFNQITEKFSQQGYRVNWSYTGPEQFQSTNQVRLPRGDCKRIIDAYKGFSGMDITP